MTTFFAFQHQISVPKNVNFSVPFPNFGNAILISHPRSQILEIDSAIPGIEKSIRAHPHLYWIHTNIEIQYDNIIIT